MTEPLTPQQIAEIKAKALAAEAICGYKFSKWWNFTEHYEHEFGKPSTEYLDATPPLTILSLIATIEARDAAFDAMLAALKLANDLVLSPMRIRRIVMDEHRHSVDEAIQYAIAQAEKVKL